MFKHSKEANYSPNSEFIIYYGFVYVFLSILINIYLFRYRSPIPNTYRFIFNKKIFFNLFFAKLQILYINRDEPNLNT